MPTILKRHRRSSPKRTHARGDDRSCSRPASKHNNLAPKRTKGKLPSRNCTQLESCSRDPIGFEGSKWNIVEYVGSNPLSGSDPSGLGITIPIPRADPRALLCYPVFRFGKMCGRQQARYVEWVCDRISSNRGPIPPLDNSDPRHPDHKTETEPKPKPVPVDIEVGVDEKDDESRCYCCSLTGPFEPRPGVIKECAWDDRELCILGGDMCCPETVKEGEYPNPCEGS